MSRNRSTCRRWSSVFFRRCLRRSALISISPDLSRSRRFAGVKALSGYLTASRFGSEWTVKLLMQIAYCGVQWAAACIQAGRPVEEWMLEPAQHALQVLSDMEHQCDRVELCVTHQATIRHRKDICRFDPAALHVVYPERFINAGDEDDEPEEAVFGRIGLTYLHGSPISGYLTRDDLGRVVWVDPKAEVRIHVTEPIFVLIPDPDKKPYEWMEEENDDSNCSKTITP